MRHTADPTRRAIWMALADQFLDTETRTWIPQTALLIVDAGYPPEKARRIWRYEVAPVVSLNVWSVAGEWAGWDEVWLCTRAEKLRGRGPVLGPLSYLLYRLSVHFIHRDWIAIERCMALFEPLDHDARQALAADLTYLARVFFDFWGGEPCRLSAQRQAELRTLYEDSFLPIFSSLVVSMPELGETAEICRQRVEAVLTR